MQLDKSNNFVLSAIDIISPEPTPLISKISVAFILISLLPSNGIPAILISVSNFPVVVELPFTFPVIPEIKLHICWKVLTPVTFCERSLTVVMVAPAKAFTPSAVCKTFIIDVPKLLILSLSAAEITILSEGSVLLTVNPQSAGANMIFSLPLNIVLPILICAPLIGANCFANKDVPDKSAIISFLKVTIV